MFVNMKINNLTGGRALEDKGLFERIISLENLFLSWKEFKRGKSKKYDVGQFDQDLESNILKLHYELKNKTYCHSKYVSFYIQDPKLRHIHKATVRDRVLHHAIFRILYPIFDKTFIFDSYSCRINKGTHRAINRLNQFATKVSKNNSRNCFILKCDIKKFFDSVNQDVLINLIKEKINNHEVVWLLNIVLKSFVKGLPMGNITSQLFANIYLNKLDQFVKHQLKIKYYIRYCDDFAIAEDDKERLNYCITEVDEFLRNSLKLYLHPSKIIIRRYHQGVDFLGYVIFPHHRVLRTKTKNRIFKKIKIKLSQLKGNKISKESFNQSAQSYSGMLNHCNGYNIKKNIVKLISEN